MKLGKWVAVHTNSHKYMAWVAKESGETVALIGGTDPEEANELADLIASVPEMLAELDEQASLNGAGSEREASLLAKLAKCEAAREA